ncbi:MAG: thermostable hemolysin [Cycloclasticus sp.]|nr:thermostable hemolysin [Cycloclasticus sp.]
MSVRRSDFKLKVERQCVDEKHKKILLPHLFIDLVAEDNVERSSVEKHIARHFYKSHKAEIDVFLPNVLTARTSKNITSTVGFRLGKQAEPLYLEQYLNNSAESSLSEILNQVVARSEIAEIGNLTSRYPGASQMLFVLVVSVLYSVGAKWALFTATPHVQKMVDDLGIEIMEVCYENPNQLSDSGKSWGGYYKNRPKVIAGNLEDAYAALKRHPVAGFMIENYQVTIDELAGQLDVGK